MDFVAITFLLGVFIYLFFTKPKVFLPKEKTKKYTLEYINCFGYTFLIKSDSEFDKEAFDLMIDFIEDKIQNLKSTEDYDILIELHICIDFKVGYHISLSTKCDNLHKKLPLEFEHNIAESIKKYPKYYPFSCVLRFHNEKPMFTDDELSRFEDNARNNLLKNVDDTTLILANHFVDLPDKEKFEFIQNYVNESGFKRIRLSIPDWGLEKKNNKLNKWIIKELYQIEEKDEIDIDYFTSKLDFWLLQFEMAPHISYVPILLGSFYLHNKKYDYAFHFFLLAFTYTHKQLWQYSYCWQILSFLKNLKEVEKKKATELNTLIESKTYNEAEKIISAQLQLNPFSAHWNSEKLYLEKLMAYDHWDQVKEKEYIYNYKQKIYQECDPFFEEGNFLLKLEDEKLNEARKTFNSYDNIYDAFFASIELSETIFETTLAVAICSDEIYYQKQHDLNLFALSISKMVREKPDKIENIFNEYVRKYKNPDKLVNTKKKQESL